MAKRRVPKLRKRERELFVGVVRSRSLPMAPHPHPKIENYDDGGEPNEPRSFAEGSSGLQGLKEDLLARGMSDAEAEAFLRQI